MKHVLLTLCGTSPAVITETICQMFHSLPDEVVVITTAIGHRHLTEELFSSGVWNRFLSTISPEIPSIAFRDNPYHIRLLPAEQGDATDVADESTSLLIADYILGTLRQFTENPDVKITFSIAGGRKTMSAIGALAMSLLGRKQDELCHVLVNPPFDSPQLSPRFYFPEPGVTHTFSDGSRHKSTSARIVLCRIPYVRQRYLFADRLNRLPGDYFDMVQLANSVIESGSKKMPLDLLPQSCLCRIGEHEIMLSAFEFTIFWLLARRRVAGEAPFICPEEMIVQYHTFVKSIPNKMMPSLLAYRQALLNKREDDLRKPVSSIGSKLKRVLGTDNAKQYLLSQRRSRYGLQLEPEMIKCPEV